jgi:hypothetical protein
MKKVIEMIVLYLLHSFALWGKEKWCKVALITNITF